MKIHLSAASEDKGNDVNEDDSRLFGGSREIGSDEVQRIGWEKKRGRITSQDGAGGIATASDAWSACPVTPTTKKRTRYNTHTGSVTICPFLKNTTHINTTNNHTH